MTDIERGWEMQRLLEKIVTNYEILLQTNGATSLIWDETHLPKHWVGCRLEGLMIQARARLPRRAAGEQGEWSSMQ